MAQQHEIRWDDSLPPFAGPGSELPEVGYAIEAMADGTNFGNPESIVEIVKSLLTDGSLAVLEGWDNRVAPIRLRISAPTAIAGPALADAEKALMAAVLRTPKAPLVYVPPAQDAATCVFDVVAAELTRDTSDGWDFDEAQREERYYLLTLTCLPFARTEESVVVPALAPSPASPTTVTVDACTATTAFSTPYVGPTLVESGQAVQAQRNSVLPAGESCDLTWTGSITMGATPYLAVDLSAEVRADASSPWVPASPSNPGALHSIVNVSLNGVGAAPVAIVGTVYYFEAPSTVTTILASVYSNYGSLAARGFRVIMRDISRTDSTSPAGTSRELSRSATVQGSAPTQAAIRVFDATPGALGSEALVYTSRSAWVPSLRPYLVSSSSVTTDSARVSGGRNTLASDMVFEVPASLIESGTYAPMALVNVSTGGDLTWSARMVDASGLATLGSEIVVSGTVALGVTSGYEVLPLGALALPVVPVEGDQKIELTLSGTADMSVDEAWLFNLDDGVLTWVRSADVEWVEIRSPELGATRPSVYGGTGAVGENGVCIDWACESFGAHRFDPGLMQIFTVASSSLVSQSEIEFYPRYHSHVEGSSAA